MPIAQLQIFSKKRDATAPLKGYEFQHYKTLECWLHNRINNIDEIIYCDYEDDIFQRNLLGNSAKFRQIKSCKANFSFSSDAIQETIANFFMLFAKWEYMFDKVTFSFETNSSVAERVIKGNDAELLQTWVNEQQNLNGEPLQKIRIRVKEILSAYIQKEYAAKIGNIDIKPELQKAINLFNELTDEVYDNFIQSIQWKFDGIKDVNTAIENQIEIINTLIEKIPLPFDSSSHVAFSLLRGEVASRSIQDDPENRKLTNRLMDLLLLQSGDEKNKWYAEIYEKWLLVNEIKEFHAGEFYEIVETSRYYRMNFHQAGHKVMWMSLLQFYINNESVKVYTKRKAIYEFLFLALKPNPELGETIDSLGGEEDKIRYYFNEWEQRNNLKDIQDDITLLLLILAQVVVKNISIDTEEINNWKLNIQLFIVEALQTKTNIDDQCILLELRGDFELHTSVVKSKEQVERAIGYYREILPILPKAQLYSVSNLFDILQQILQVLIRFKKEHSIIEQIETLLDEMQDVAVASGQRHIAAKSMVNRGADYLKAGGVSNFLHTTNCFHKAKALWYLESTKEGYILSLLNLSQVYYALGMNIAGKYYALCSIWATWHFKNESIFNRIVQGTGLLFYGDFKQGNWISALDDFELFMKTREEFNAEGWSGNNDEFFSKTLPDIAFLIFASKKFLPEISVYIDYRVSKWGDLWNVFVKPMVEELDNQLTESQKVINVAKRNINGEPLADLGKERIIAFDALNINWLVNFDNTHTLTAIGEEFVSILQILLCEIARSNTHFLTIGKTIAINIQEASAYERIKKHQSKDDWIASIPKFNGKLQSEISYHYAFISLMIKEIFFSITTFKEDDFNEYWWKILHEKEKVGDKVFSTNTYQKAYYNAVDEKAFNNSQRTAFNSLPPHTVFTQLPKLLI
jgi:hypothetical protein